jgi:hypothetical protein
VTARLEQLQAEGVKVARGQNEEANSAVSKRSARPDSELKTYSQLVLRDKCHGVINVLKEMFSIEEESTLVQVISSQIKQLNAEKDVSGDRP